ncbi:hypothetical protein PIB30_101156 [Stylosanthes scabra]|uniref:Uncharacterized protein n=1 Tax=Stylosanthes scabra TaxID=79078 RepID=A0ABU6TZC1_9FABA|nr:hypothetical protein [Stylosanthes scabra]
MRPIAPFSPRPAASPSSSAFSGSVESVHRERSRSPRTPLPPMAPAPVPGPVYQCRVHRCATPGDTVVSFLVIELHLLHLLLLLRLVMKSLLRKRTIQQQIWKEIPMSSMLLSKYLMEPPKHITLMPHTGRSAKALVLVRHRLASHHSSGSSSRSVSLGYGSASSGSASDEASDDDLVNRYFAGTFPPP